MTEKIQQLLNKVGEISGKYETVAKATGDNFNIFEIVGISHKEVYMCRILSELLNPDGSHYQGNIYLRLFFETLKQNHGDKFDFKTPENAEVLKEEGIEECRRIDITIDDKENRQYLPIEVKIYAGDQKEQCRDYLKKAKEKYNQGENARLCYLTIEGHLPDKTSLCDVAQEQIITISWKKDILEWLNACIIHPNTVTKAPIREILIQFKKAVQKFTNQFEENEEMEIKDIIKQSKENLENAQKISGMLFDTQNDIWENIKEIVKNKINLTAKDDNKWQLYYESGNSKKIGLYFNSDAGKNIELDPYYLAGVVYTNNNIEDKYNEANISTLICGKDCFNQKMDEYTNWIIEQLKRNNGI